jgi:hypothetical protein
MKESYYVSFHSDLQLLMVGPAGYKPHVLSSVHWLGFLTLKSVLCPVCRKIARVSE